MINKLLSFFVVLLYSVSVYAQDSAKLTGVVTDKLGPLPGVTIQIKGTTTGSTTNYNGEFSLNAQPEDILIFSFIGYTSKEVPVGNKTTFNVTLEEDSQQLKEVVVTGYQEIDRNLFTGSAETLSMEDVQVGGLPDASQSLEGNVAGVSVSSVSGTFGSSPKIRIRGNASINGNNQPLWVVDGVVLEDIVELNGDISSGDLETLLGSSIAGLNPDDIESIDVLKDASATSMYGAAAMNGVIVVNTKKGKDGSMRVSYSGNYTINEKPSISQFNKMSSSEEMDIFLEMIDKGWIDVVSAATSPNGGIVNSMYTKLNSKELTWDRSNPYNGAYLEKASQNNTDWFDHLFKNSFSQQHTLNIRGGSKKVNYYTSVGFYDDQGRTIADNVKKYNATSNIDFTLFDKLEVGFSLKGSFRDQQVPGSQDRIYDSYNNVYTRAFDINPLNYAATTSRSIGINDYTRRNYADFNILHELANNTAIIEVGDISFQNNLKYNFNDKFSAFMVTQLRRVYSSTEQRVHANTNQVASYQANQTKTMREGNKLLYRDLNDPYADPYVILDNGGILKQESNKMHYNYVRAGFNYMNTFNDKHALSVLAGSEYKSTKRYNSTNTNFGVQFDRSNNFIINPYLTQYHIASGIKPNELSSTIDNFWGIFTNASYSYDERYTVGATVRYDGSNRLGNLRSVRYLPSWNISGAWNITGESFMEDQSLFDRLKIRTTYGISGNMPKGASTSLQINSGTTQRLKTSDNEVYSEIDKLANLSLTWEKMKEFNIGVDYGILQGRISGSVDYYQRNSYDLIGWVPTNGVGGKEKRYNNGLALDSYGFDILINTKNIDNENFGWVTSFNWGLNKSKVITSPYKINANEAVRYLGGNVQGYPSNALFSYNFDGLDNEGKPIILGSKGERLTNVSLQTRDLKDLKFEGTVNPIAFGGITNTFNYKNVSFSFLISYSYGNKIRLGDLVEDQYNDQNSFDTEMRDRWVVLGDEKRTRIPVIMSKREKYDYKQTGDMSYAMYNKSQDRVANGDFIKLKRVSLNYQLPVKMLESVHIQNASVGFQAHNLFMLYSDEKLRGRDPEFYVAGGVSLPPTRSYTMSLKVSF
ncbi:SusC/RagA family TonB-linked outer membrane protein [Flammeovirga kamogawensis]|uniref:SusC/RagA family TonB-linked outer membrane protein n=1 Tax=Flammeovirga kamogawensis TaxID=373891 RepID=A0ABX8H495_9BACT|nr:SusC/RagA family TonB-linked outer membrane protein [Flammeovirga kamogawensis]MBB6460168.1 TonB-linked SusC/RagA family outer membrane protein [Flammeovirga kamogawensis]QWG09980.1 SusC/RagA family TonB-linked outer membrane protein [Flammeovirga kamogawensis]TRX65488.1 SusC/RagA family TonB-linked outer membrane protein [Flammeovirga kamogawensis]